MNGDTALLFSTFGVGVALTLIIGFYCVLTTRSLIRVLIGLEILTKAVTLLIILVGYVTGQMALGQALAITLIIIEVAVIVVAVSVVLALFKHDRDIDATALRNLKG
jgi:multisubunit Na+/H+ antiporter MnhC subunit